MLPFTGVSIRLALSIFVGSVLHAQPLPTGFARGVVIDKVVAEFGNDFRLRSANNTVYRFHCDGKTWIEREHERLDVSGLRTGELIEVVSDRDPDASQVSHYARMVQVITITKQVPKFSGGIYNRPVENGFNITKYLSLSFAGLVIQLTGDKMILRTRVDGDRIIYLRPDTRCLKQGSEVDAATLHPNTRVFVEAVPDAGNNLEAYRVIWGGILEPASLRE